MFAEVRSKKCSEIADKRSDEHYDSYEILPEMQCDKGISDNKAGSEKDDDFVNELTCSINKKMRSVSNGKPGPAQMVEMTKFFIDKSAEVAKFCEEQRTKRVEIRANAQVAIHQIDAVREFLQSYLDKTFDERRMLFAKEFEIVDKCLATGNVQALAVSLNAITDLAKSSPFKALADIKSVKNAIENHSTFDI